MSRVEKKQPQYGSDVVVDLMKAFDIEYAAFNPGATFRGIHDSIVNYFSKFAIQSELMPSLSTSGESSGLYTTSLMALDEVSHGAGGAEGVGSNRRFGSREGFSQRRT